MLPTKLGFSPYLLVFKQAPPWGAVNPNGLELGEPPGEEEQEELVAQ